MGDNIYIFISNSRNLSYNLLQSKSSYPATDCTILLDMSLMFEKKLPAPFTTPNMAFPIAGWSKKFKSQHLKTVLGPYMYENTGTWTIKEKSQINTQAE